MQISQDLRFALHDRSQAPPEVASPITQSGFGMVSAAGPSPDSAVHPRSSPAAWEQSGPDYPLVAILGPTASGKSALALHLAAVLGGEIVNYDSVQLYRGFDVGSGKISLEERVRITHHLLGVLDSGEVMTAGQYRLLAVRVLEEIRGRGNVPILVGGTGLYLRALLRGLFEGPARSDALRARLRAIGVRHGSGFLHRVLRRVDPEAARRIHPHDEQKVVRAAEVCFLSGEPISRLHASGREALRGFRVLKAGLNPDRRALRERIDRRVEWMFSSGLLEEAREMLAGVGASAGVNSSPFAALGYPQACQVLRGEISLAEAVRSTQAATRRYAKRQLTWFRREPGVTWFDGFGDEVDLQSRAAHWVMREIPRPELQEEFCQFDGGHRAGAERRLRKNA